jgi:hypothetical protein
MEYIPFTPEFNPCAICRMPGFKLHDFTVSLTLLQQKRNPKGKLQESCTIMAKIRRNIHCVFENSSLYSNLCAVLSRIIFRTM